MEAHTSPDPPLAPVDYDKVQHQTYARGRVLPAEAIARYMAVFAEHLPERRPLAGIDLGSGTGRFSPALADAFGGPVWGVEPADGMRAAAVADAAHPHVTYLAGRAEAIPRPDASADFVLMFLSWHHVADKLAAAREIARVLRPGGRLILRSTFQERIPDHWWRGYFPRSWDIERAMFQTEAEVRGIVEAAGFGTVASVRTEVPFEGDIANLVERLKHRAVSTFEHMTEEELREGFDRIDADLAAGAIVEKPTFGDFIVFETPQEPAIA
ncbi:class I SAM-dependent methyltransferase [Phenylobacterium sp.]|uniref:class I SAM-dependent methyltransferase n=1 Tax=Phenylobacterium sp. TaxID=1871053 RepID=UPI0025F144BB|nr:class I SAM-dependent methyltransferase [Phenylobacterium sp.]MBX3482307.1 class I SAM-dependent methyltransferase [Phenylobacterium sp.]